VFSFFIFHPFFSGDHLTPFAAMCGRPWLLPSPPLLLLLLHKVDSRTL